MAIQVRRGNEADFDANKMLPGEWAVSLDTKHVRMCFAPGVVLRMATYEGFEADKAQIQAILAECRSIQEVVRRIGNEVSEKASLTIEYSNSAKESAERAKIYADNAEAVTGVHIATKDTAGIIKGGDNYIAEDGTLTLITKTTETTMNNSCEGRVLFKEIRGKTEQGANPSPTNPQEIKSVSIRGIKTHGKNLLDGRGLKENTSHGVTFTPIFDANGNLEYIEANGTNDGTALSEYSIGVSLTIGEEYTLSGCPSNVGDSIYYTVQMSFFGVDTGSGFTGKITENVVQSVSIYVINGYTANKLRFYPMIRKAYIADSTYEPYTESVVTLSQPIELYGIGDVQDVIDFENGKIIRRIKTLHGTSGWVKTNVESSTSGYRYYIAVPDRVVLNNCEVICSHYTHMVGSSYWDEGDYISTNEANCIIIRSTNIRTLDEFNNALAGMKICYPLATPIEEALPIADQVALNSVKTFDDTTCLEFDSPLQPEFVAEYGTSKVGGVALESLLVARNNEIRISALETSAVNNI